MRFTRGKIQGFFFGLLIVIFFMSMTPVSAIMIPLSIEELTHNADGIIIGNVTDTRSDWINNNTTIQTWVTVSVTDVLKGNLTNNRTITILTEGGIVGDYQLWVEDEPSFTKGQLYGIFLRQTNSSDFQVLGSYQGVIELVVEAPLIPQKGGVTITLMEEFKNKIFTIINGGEFYTFSPIKAQINNYFENQRSSDSNPLITSITPNSAPAGTDVIIVIKGSGFGTKANRNSDADVAFFFQSGSSMHYIYASGYCYSRPNWQSENDNNIISWTDTQIITKVPIGLAYDGSRPYPGSASSGPILVYTDDKKTSNPYPFTITFGYGKAKWLGDNSTVSFYVNNQDGNYIKAVNKAANTWNSAPAKNFQYHYIGTTSSAGMQGNGKNEIFWGDTQSLAVTKMLTNGQLNLYGDILETDIAFNNKLKWNSYLPSSNEYDVETIALHEMGHWLALQDLYGDYTGYPSDQNKIMYGFFNYGEIRRTLSPSDIAGIQYIYPKTTPPTTGLVSIQSNPAGAKIYLDGADTGFVTPKTLPNVPTGSHIILCRLNGYDDGSQSVNVIAGQTVSVQMILKKTEVLPPGSITRLGNTTFQQTLITWTWTDPSSADFEKVMVYLNGVFQSNVTKGSQKFTATGLNPSSTYTIGTHSIGATGLINLTWVNSTAKTAPNTPSAGSTSIQSNPTGAKIFLDGADTGFVTPKTISNVPAGSHVILCRLSGYADNSQTVSVFAGQTAMVSIDLVSIPTTGSISIQSNPTGAKIYLDYADTGFVTPKTLPNLAAGSHVIRCSLSGYDDTTQNISVVPGQTTDVMITLQKSGNVAPKADFSASAREGGNPLPVQFTDKSTNSPTSWAWTFGDGSTSTEKNPAHTYVKSGMYSVKLKVSNPAGSNGLSRSGYIVVSSGPLPTPIPTASPTPTPTPTVTPTTTPTPIPTLTPTPKPTPTPTPEPGVLKAGFTADLKTGTQPLVVSFRDLSTGIPTSWSWAFGDGTTSTEQNPTHTYLKAGMYSVKLKVSNSDGSSGLSRSGYIIVSNG